MDLFFRLIFGAFLGAVSGYYTNIIALKTLFSNNGIIAKEKNRFIDEISKMVSEKIINYSSVYNEIKKDKFKNNIKELFKKIKNQLILKTNFKIKYIEGFEQTRHNIINWTETNTNDGILIILEKLSKNIRLNQIINDDQFKNIVSNLINEFLLYEADNHLIENTVLEIYNNKDDKYKSILKEITYNIFDKLKSTDNSADKNKKNQIESLIKFFIEHSNIENCFYDFSFSLLDNKVNELFSINDVSEIKSIIDKLVNNNEFESIAYYVIDILYTKLKSTDKTIYELLNPNIAERIKFIISDIISRLIDIIVPIINENKSKLECIIEEAVDEEIENIDGFFRQFIVKIIRKVFFQDIASRYRIIQKIIEYVEKYKDNTNDIVNDVSKTIINYLNNTKISAILKNIDNDKIIKNSVRDIIIFNIKEIPDSWIEKFLNMNISVLADSDIIKDLYVFLEREIINYACSNFYKLESLIYKEIDSLNSQILKKLLSNNASGITVIISKNKLNIENYIYNNIYLKYKDKTINGLFNDFESVSELLFDLFESIIDKYSDYNIDEIIIKKENQIDYFIDNNSYNSIMSFFNKEKVFISSVMDSIVIKTIKNNMGKLNKDEIANMAYDFMGKELEPINILGAFLGLVFGLLTAYIFPFNSFNPSLGFLNYIAEPLVYTLIGYITNVLAIYSIFQPYEPLFGIKKKVFWGAVACEKNRFASSMSDFVNDRLMEKEGILDIIDNKKDIEENLIKDNYKIFFNYMIEDEKISKLNIFSSIKYIIINNIDSVKSGIINLFIKNNYMHNAVMNNKDSLINYVYNNIDLIIIKISEAALENIDIFTVKELIQNIIRNNFKDFNKYKNIITDNIVKALNSKSVKDRILSIIISFLNNEISKNGNKKIKDMFGGEILNLVKSNNEFIFSMINKKLNETLNNNRYEIRDMIIENVSLKNDLVIDLTDRIILNLINIKIPSFIDEMKDNIINTSFNFLDENILSENISYIFGEEKLYNRESLGVYLNDIINNNQELISNVSERLFILAVNNIDYKFVYKYIDLFIKNTDYDFYELIMKSCNNKEKLSLGIKDYIKKSIYPYDIKECVSIEKYSDDIFSDILEYSKSCIEMFLTAVQNNDNIIDLNIFYKLLDELELNENLNYDLYAELKKILLKFRNDFPDIIDNKTKYYFLNLFIDCAKDNINLIIDSIDFSYVAKEKIDKMNPKNIHDIFNSFAEKYFDRLKLYGMFGGIVGIILVIIKYISEFNADLSDFLNIILISASGVLSLFMIISIFRNTVFKR